MQVGYTLYFFNNKFLNTRIHALLKNNGIGKLSVVITNMYKDFIISTCVRTVVIFGMMFFTYQYIKFYHDKYGAGYYRNFRHIIRSLSN